MQVLFLAPPVGLEPTTLSVRNIVALLAWSASQCSLFLPAQSTASSAVGSAVRFALTRSAPDIQCLSKQKVKSFASLTVK